MHQQYEYHTHRTQNNNRDLYTFTRPDTKPLLFGLKARVGNQDIKMLLDPGSTITMMSKNLQAKLNQQILVSRGSTTMLLIAAAGCSKQCRSDLTTLRIKTGDETIENNGFLVDKTLAKIKPKDLVILK